MTTETVGCKDRLHVLVEIKMLRRRLLRLADILPLLQPTIAETHKPAIATAVKNKRAVVFAETCGLSMRLKRLIGKLEDQQNFRPLIQLHLW